MKKFKIKGQSYEEIIEADSFHFKYIGESNFGSHYDMETITFYKSNKIINKRGKEEIREEKIAAFSNVIFVKQLTE